MLNRAQRLFRRISRILRPCRGYTRAGYNGFEDHSCDPPDLPSTFEAPLLVHTTERTIYHD